MHSESLLLIQQALVLHPVQLFAFTCLPCSAVFTNTTKVLQTKFSIEIGSRSQVSIIIGNVERKRPEIAQIVTELEQGRACFADHAIVPFV